MVHPSILLRAVEMFVRTAAAGIGNEMDPQQHVYVCRKWMTLNRQGCLLSKSTQNEPIALGIYIHDKK
jgi:hypothetical protein